MSGPGPDGLVLGEDGRSRCWWCAGHEDYRKYHDEEWGVPVEDDVRLFEKICLEGFQSGLSWLTILRKRDNFRAAFADFDFDAIAEFGESDVETLLNDAGIVRHRKKIESTINNARRAVELRDEFGSLSEFFWRYEPPPEDRPETFDLETLRSLSKTRASKALARDLKKRGWTWVGPTTAYAFMQSMGIVNDHLEGCFARPLVTAAPRQKVPGDSVSL